MAENPKYVRLCNRLTRGMMADVHGSGWSIAGLDVKPFPEAKHKLAVKYVKRALRDGYLEPAGAAEYEEVKDATLTSAMLAEDPDFLKNTPVQEARLQEAIEERVERIIASRLAADKARDKADSDDDEDDLDEDDDPDNDGEDEGEKSAAKAKGSTSKSSKSKKGK